MLREAAIECYYVPKFIVFTMSKYFLNADKLLFLHFSVNFTNVKLKSNTLVFLPEVLLDFQSYIVWCNICWRFINWFPNIIGIRYSGPKRNEVLECLNQYNIPMKLQELIALTLTWTNATVKINNEFTDKFEVQTGVKQGDPLSATLFRIAMDFILKKMELRGNISTRLKQCAAYADDIVITSRTAQRHICEIKKRITKIWPNSKCT